MHSCAPITCDLKNKGTVYRCLNGLLYCPGPPHFLLLPVHLSSSRVPGIQTVSLGRWKGCLIMQVSQIKPKLVLIRHTQLVFSPPPPFWRPEKEKSTVERKAFKTFLYQKFPTVQCLLYPLCSVLHFLWFCFNFRSKSQVNFWLTDQHVKSPYTGVLSSQVTHSIDYKKFFVESISHFSFI